MAGYECADHLNKFGQRVDLLTATGHIPKLKEDYHDLSAFGIKTVREGIRWSIVEQRAYHYDWTVLSEMIRVGKLFHIQQVWDLCHFGMPDDLTPLHPLFADRFEALCRSFVAHFREQDLYAPILVTPMNEVSFLSWLGGEAVGTTPYCTKQGWEVKYHLMRAYIRGVVAMKLLDPNVLIVSTEPLIHIVPADDASDDEISAAAKQREEQFQMLDMLCGRICPELGGRPEYLDIVGLNFYYSNQWTYGTAQSLAWADHDRHPSWLPLSELLREVYNRYRKPFFIAETSHPGEGRPLWIKYIATECALALQDGLPLLGVCIYPIIDRPDWDFPDLWHHSGLWDNLDILAGGTDRSLYIPYANAVMDADHFLAPLLSQPSPGWVT